MSELKLVRMSELKSEPISWLWPQRVARGKVTLLAGDPGVGKSFVTCDIAARITGADGWPDGGQMQHSPGDVVFLSAEDDPADTIAPRLKAAGADLNRVRFVEGVDRPDDRSMGVVELDRDCAAISRALRSCERPRLIVIDPISAYLGRTDGNSNSEVRAVLGELSRVAAFTGAAVLCVTHLSKGNSSGGNGKVVYRAMGSLAFTAAARMVWYASRLPGDDHTRAMTLVKSNITGPVPGMTYTIDAPETDEAGAPIAQPKLRWLSADLAVSADEIEEAGNEPGAVNEATEFLRVALHGGPRAASEIIKEAEGVGISLASLRRAKRMVGVVARQGTDGSRGWVWSMN